ncbi:MAG: flagellar basal body P-ring formation protein FlgA [Gemmatimonadaceae bacterium]|nr:flagellar basal body P-ring formation protein FlgA [Gemmatimonadaceae bacterium]
MLHAAHAAHAMSRVVRPALRALLLPVAMVAGRSLPAQERGASVVVASPLAATTEALVATRRLVRGTVLKASDIARTRVRARLDANGHARAESLDVTPGWIARRVIQPGEVLRAPAVAPAPLVAAGQAVRFTYQQDGLELSLDGVAPVAGALGDTIPVRLGARRLLSGIVAGPALVVAIDLSRTP